uniref:Lambda-recombinase-like protein n=1 Tax=Nothobranchius pienaari TaxID=704102 RepID=A0A1A8LYX8_9TELE
MWSVRHFAALLDGHHVEVHADSQVAAAYINRQGGVRSLPLLRVATDLLCWAHVHLLSIKATYIPRVLNVAADILSRGGPRDSDWRLHPALISQIWIRFGEPSVDLFTARENAQCRLWFSLSPRDHPPLGADAFSHQPWSQTLLYASPGPSSVGTALCNSGSSQTLVCVMVYGPASASVWLPVEGGRPSPGGWDNQTSSRNRPTAVGLAAERSRSGFLGCLMMWSPRFRVRGRLLPSHLMLLNGQLSRNGAESGMFKRSPASWRMSYRFCRY